MIDSSSDSLINDREFIDISEFWIESSYIERKKPGALVPNLQKFVRITIHGIIDEWNISILPLLFHEFVEIILKYKPEGSSPLYGLGELFRAFDNIFSFQMQDETFKSLKLKLLNGEIEADWLDIPFLSNYYRTFSRKNKITRFNIRNLILLAIRIKNRKLKDINLKFKSF